MKQNQLAWQRATTRLTDMGGGGGATGRPGFPSLCFDVTQQGEDGKMW